MKFSIDIECTPEEARAFFGLPDVKPMQDALMAQLQERLSAGLAATEPDALLRYWLPLGMQNLEQFQRAFWSGMTPGDRSGDESKS
mgnify:CR=1 FL=1